MTIQEMSLVNHPVLSKAGLHTHANNGSRVWSLSFAAQFANSCLAMQGVTPRYIDKPSATNANDGLRIIFVEQNLSPAGCPDIYQPQKKMFSIDMPIDTRIKQLLLLNYFAPQPAWQRDYQIAMLAMDQAIGTRPQNSYQPLIPQGFATATTLPTLSNIVINVDAGTTSTFRYTIGFDARFDNSCDADNGIEVRLIESRSNPSSLAQETMHDWLLVIQRNGPAPCNAATQPVTRHFTLQRDLHPSYKRQLLVLNPRGQPATTQKPFHVLNVWEGKF